MAQNLDLRCVLAPAPWVTLGAGAKTRLGSRTQKFKPHCVCRPPLTTADVHAHSTASAGDAHYSTTLTTATSDYGIPLTTADVTYGQPSTGEQPEYDVLEQPSVVAVVLERPYEVEAPDYVHRGMERLAAETVRPHVCVANHLLVADVHWHYSYMARSKHCLIYRCLGRLLF